MAAKTPAPVTLAGRFVCLVPLTMDHLGDIFAAGGASARIRPPETHGT
ncbi:MAG TPA: hypothetical protein VN840_09635 [Streptosporangiaceae bacterium]|nr:hypothetical protein [Streptosporangiaceae bacterium]